MKKSSSPGSLKAPPSRAYAGMIKRWQAVRRWCGATPNSSACMPQGEGACQDAPSAALWVIGTELQQLLSQAHSHRGNYEVGVMSASSLRAY
jgi:hypothetical protein